MLSDPVLAFVAVGQVGQMATVTEPGYGGSVMVGIESEYYAASGRECKTYSLTPLVGGATQRLGCGDGASWSTVPPLITPQNQVAVQ